MKVIGVVGLPASGKGEFSHIARDMGIPVIVMGDVIRKAVEDAGMEPTDENMGVVSRKLRETKGMAAIAESCVPWIEEAGAPLVLVDGIRGDAEVRLFKEKFPDFILVSIDAPSESRLARLALRGRPDDANTLAELEARDAREGAWGLYHAMKEADYHLENMDSIGVFRKKVQDLLGEVAGT
jgi:dephospho-CoA kinase